MNLSTRFLRSSPSRFSLAFHVWKRAPPQVYALCGVVHRSSKIRPLLAHHPIVVCHKLARVCTPCILGLWLKDSLDLCKSPYQNTFVSPCSFLIPNFVNSLRYSEGDHTSLKRATIWDFANRGNYWTKIEARLRHKKGIENLKNGNKEAESVACGQGTRRGDNFRWGPCTHPLMELCLFYWNCSPACFTSLPLSPPCILHGQPTCTFELNDSERMIGS